MIARDDPRAPDVRALLERHLARMREITPPEDVHALDVDALADPSVTFFSHREGGAPLAVGALRRIDAAHAEIKSMHTAEEARGRGLGRAMAEHLLAVARERDFARVSLETGAGPEFAPARALYASLGFEDCGPFADRAFAEPLDVAAVARAAHVSPAHFSRQFRATFGESPHRHLQRRRVERAMELLRETDRPVTEICFAVGFNSLGTFSRTFRAILGEPPSAYRARFAGEGERLRAPACWAMAWTRPAG